MDSHFFKTFVNALEVIPFILKENSGLKSIDIVTELRKAHDEGNAGAGIDVKKGFVSDMYEMGVVQPFW